ncbi:MAG TPA: copper chaperone PCu(A)C [Thermodesulfobacteriota bacterium]
MPLRPSLVLLAVLLAAPAIAPASAAEPSLVVRDAWVRATPGAAAVSSHAASRGGHDAGATAAYLTLENRGDRADRLVSVASPVAGRAELHESRVENGIMRMRPVEGIAVPAGGSVRLEPGGLHVMLMGLHEPIAEGRRVPLTLTFESGATLAVDAEVRSR